MTRMDHHAWSLAKPQRQEAYTGGKKSKCKYSRLTIDSKPVKIHGLKTFEEKVQERFTRSKVMDLTPFNIGDE